MIDKNIQNGQSTWEEIGTSISDYLKSLGHFPVLTDSQIQDEPIVQHFLSHLIFWMYKDVYYETADRYTTGVLSSPYTTYNLEANRRTLERNIKRTVSRKRAEAAANRSTTEYYDLVGHKDLRTHEVSPSYHLSKLDYKAIQEYAPSTGQLKIVDLLANKKIGNSKAVSGQTIAEAYQEYYEYIQRGAKQEKAVLWLESLIDLSSLESQLAPGFLFAVAKYAEAHKIKRIPSTLGLLHGIIPIPCIGYCGTVQIPTHSRFLYDRMAYIEALTQQNFTMDAVIIDIIEQLLFIQGLVLSEREGSLTIFKYEPALHDRLLAVDPESAAEYFERTYNLFKIYNFEELSNPSFWTSKLLKVYRNVVTSLTSNGVSGS